jgi:hypothetical protein
MYTSVDFTSQITGWRGVPCPTNKGVSYTNLVWFGCDLKNRLLLLLLLILLNLELLLSSFQFTRQ